MANFFSKGVQKLNEGVIDIDTDTISVMLLNSTGVNLALKNTTEFMGELDGTVNQVTKTTADTTVLVTLGITIAASTIDVANDEVEWDSTNVLSWTSVSGSAQVIKGLLLYKSTGTASQSPVIAIHDMSDGVGNPNGGKIIVNFKTEGIVKAFLTGTV